MDQAKQECGADCPTPSEVSLLGEETSAHPNLPDQGSFQWQTSINSPGSLWRLSQSTSRGVSGPREATSPFSYLLLLFPPTWGKDPPMGSFFLWELLSGFAAHCAFA